MSGLSSGVVMVSAGEVLLRVVCFVLCVLEMISGECVCVARLSDFVWSCGSWIYFDVEECVGCAWGV